MVRLPFLCGLILGMLLSLAASCGGGGGGGGDAVAAPPAVAIWSDSITTGTYGNPDGSVGRLDVPPVARMNQLAAGRLVVADHSVPGMTTRNALQGGFSWLHIPPTQPFAEFVRSTSASVIVLRFGTADALLLVTPEEFRTNLQLMVRMASAAGKRVVLVEPIAQGAGVIYADPIAAIVREIAQQEAALFVPVRDLPAVLRDDIHPDQATADRMAARIVEQLLALMASTDRMAARIVEQLLAVISTKEAGNA